MSGLPNITDVTNESFQAQVVERSQTVPVLVDYWQFSNYLETRETW